MIEVEMRQQDVTHLSRIEAERADLVRGRHLQAEVRTQQGQEEPAQSAARAGDIARSEPGVDEDEPVVAFDEDAVAGQAPAAQYAVGATIHEPSAGGAGGDAVQVMHAHTHQSSTRPRRPRGR